MSQSFAVNSAYICECVYNQRQSVSERERKVLLNETWIRNEFFFHKAKKHKELRMKGIM
jgi:hypothetical protein